MEKKGLSISLMRKKHPTLLAGLVIAGVHFVITVSILLIMENTVSVFYYLSEFITRVLLAPGIIPIYLISDLLQITTPALDDFSLSTILALVCSSAYYGITGSFLESKQNTLQRAGIVFIVILILSSCLAVELFY